MLPRWAALVYVVAELNRSNSAGGAGRVPTRTARRFGAGDQPASVHRPGAGQLSEAHAILRSSYKRETVPDAHVQALERSLARARGILLRIWALRLKTGVTDRSGYVSKPLELQRLRALRMDNLKWEIVPRAFTQ